MDLTQDCYSPQELSALMERVNTRYEDWKLDEDTSGFLLSVVEAWKDDSESGDFLEWLCEATSDLVWSWARLQADDDTDFTEPRSCDHCREHWAINSAEGDALCADCIISYNKERGD